MTTFISTLATHPDIRPEPPPLDIGCLSSWCPLHSNSPPSTLISPNIFFARLPNHFQPGHRQRRATGLAHSATGRSSRSLEVSDSIFFTVFASTSSFTCASTFTSTVTSIPQISTSDRINSSPASACRRRVQTDFKDSAAGSETGSVNYNLCSIPPFHSTQRNKLRSALACAGSAQESKTDDPSSTRTIVEGEEGLWSRAPCVYIVGWAFSVKSFVYSPLVKFTERPTLQQSARVPETPAVAIISRRTNRFSIASASICQTPVVRWLLARRTLQTFHLNQDQF